MAFVLPFRLLPWLRRRLPPPDACRGRLDAPAPVAEDEAVLDAEVMRRRVRHFCEECPPPRRARR